ncbi:hypothetical protein Tco_0316785 [Tanacetum coccineum]
MVTPGSTLCPRGMTLHRVIIPVSTFAQRRMLGCIDCMHWEWKIVTIVLEDVASHDLCGDPNHLIGECPKPPRDKNQRAFVGGSWSDIGEEDDEKIKDETCLVAQAPNEVCSESSYFSDENSSIDNLALDKEYDKL